MDENYICIADEMHFLIELDNHRTLESCGDSEAKYYDVVSGSEGMTMMVSISGGTDAIIEAPFLIFHNAIECILNNGFLTISPCFRTVLGPKVGWIESSSPVSLREKFVWLLPHGRKHILFVDICSRHLQ